MQKENHRRKEKKVALVHDFLLYPGGAEKVLESFAQLYPDAPIYTLLYDEKNMRGMFAHREIRTSFLQRWPRWIRTHHRWLLAFFGSAVETINLRDFDVVFSSSGAWTKGLVTRLNTMHIAYIHSPMRYVWDENERYLKQIVPRYHFFLRQILSYLRVWDYQAAQRPDMLIANSLYTQQRIKKYYRKDARVIYPPVAIPSLLNLTSQQKRTKQPFIIIARLSPYKNVALAVRVCKKLQLPLIVVGEGSEYARLSKEANDLISFRSWVSEEEKWDLLTSARALLFPSEDDFGLVCVEALGAGIPVIALGRGGAKEMITDGVHGTLFAAPTDEVMADGIRRFLLCENQIDQKTLTSRAQEFSPERFTKEITSLLT